MEYVSRVSFDKLIFRGLTGQDTVKPLTGPTLQDLAIYSGKKDTHRIVLSNPSNSQDCGRDHMK